MDQLVPPALGWPMIVSGVLMLTVVVAATVVAWRQHVDTQATLRRMDADDERWAAHRQRQERLAKIRDRLYLEGLSEERRAEELEGRARFAERERRAQELLAQEEAARGDGTDARG
jgi:hypothetical protein